MDSYSQIWDWIGANANALGVVVPLVIAIGSALWGFLSYISLKKQEVREKQLHLYHDLVRRLVAPDATGILKLDSQIAIIYELTNFPAYYPVTERILKGLKKTWPIDRIQEEIDVALARISKR